VWVCVPAASSPQLVGPRAGFGRGSWVLAGVGPWKVGGHDISGSTAASLKPYLPFFFFSDFFMIVK
jgi:hypothetical protein